MKPGNNLTQKTVGIRLNSISFVCQVLLVHHDGDGLSSNCIGLVLKQLGSS